MRHESIDNLAIQWHGNNGIKLKLNKAKCIQCSPMTMCVLQLNGPTFHPPQFVFVSLCTFVCDVNDLLHCLIRTFSIQVTLIDSDEAVTRVYPQKELPFHHCTSIDRSQCAAGQPFTQSTFAFRVPASREQMQ